MINIKENERLSIMNHSCAHLLAQAVKHLYPNALFWVGPVIEEGFYYDIDLGDKFKDMPSHYAHCIKNKEEDCCQRPGLTLWALIVQGIATSIDALSVGFTIADYYFPAALLAAFIIAVITLLEFKGPALISFFVPITILVVNDVVLN